VTVTVNVNDTANGFYKAIRQKGCKQVHIILLFIFERIELIMTEMFFNFKLFTVFCIKAYNNVVSTCYTIEQILSVFAYFFSKYEAVCHEIHPNIKVKQIERIIEIMPFYEDVYNRCVDIEPNEYYSLIDSYFKTEYKKGCDRNINHFFSGNIRAMRAYEVL
jgi:hypothetical protein